MQFQEQLMATNSNFLLGNWLAQANNFGTTAYEKQLAEKNARMQISIWGPDTNSATDLHEYAHKEWSGLIKDLYEPRWQLFFEQLDNEMAGKPNFEVNYFAMELNWANQLNKYSTKTKGDYLQVIKKITEFLDDSDQ